MSVSSPGFSAAGTVPNTLEIAQQNYQYNYVYLPSVALIDQLPEAEEFPEEWFWLLAHQLRELFVNTLITNRGNRGTESVRDDVRDFIFEAVLKGMIPAQVGIIARLLQILPQVLMKSLSKDLHELDHVFFAIVKANGLEIFQDAMKRVTTLLYKTQPTGHATSLEDYEKLFPVLPAPPIAQTFQQDETFAYLQVAGYNPLMIQQVNHLGDRFPVQEEHYQAVMGEHDSLERAGQEGRLYLADYGILAGAIDGTYPSYQKYLYAPLALFAVPPGNGPNRYLRPIAIQCGQTSGDEFPIITPKSGEYAWLMAKTMVQIADANFHEPVSHLARTHLFIGAFVMGTHRQLQTSHPVNLLLRPHFACTLAINDAARRILVAPDGGVDRLLSSTIDNSRVLAVKGLQSYRFNDAMLPKQLQLRGVDDPERLPIYPYRDDALLIWDAIHHWVSDYVSLYYATDQEVQQDRALQAWAREVTAHEGGRIRGFGEAGGLQTRSYLVDALTLIIFTASAQHAAVNFPQGDLMSYAPAVPMAGYLPAATVSGEVTQQDYLKLLPPLDQAQRQYNLLALLGSVYYNKLGDYPPGHFTDPKVKPLLQSFQDKLQQIEETIAQRNLSRPLYEYLLPSRVPQSINI